MPHALTELRLAEVTRPAVLGSEPAHEIHADVCVVGAGIAGLSAAIESARLHRDVVLVDSLPLIGGQMVHSLIGLFCGVFGNSPDYAQLTHGIFDDIFRDLGPSGDLHFQRGHTTTVYYNEVVLGRWLEQTVRSLGIRTVLGTVLQRADLTDGRISEIELASRYGNVTVQAAGFVDACDIEVAVEGALLDGMLCLASCDKTAPGQLMAAARLNIPSVIVACGYQPSGTYRGRHCDIEDVFLAAGHVANGKLTVAELTEMSEHAVLGPGVCAGLGTANTMHLACEALGMALPGITPVRANSEPMWRAVEQATARIVDGYLPYPGG